MAWAKPAFPKGRIDWAGELLANDSDNDSSLEIDIAEQIVNNWRAIHSYPLQAMKMTLKRRAKKIYEGAIVAQRLKRLASIKMKLKLSKRAGNNPKLSQMQDIGGCRAVMDTIDQVRLLEKTFEESAKKSPHRGPQYSKTYDYLSNPKSNGYRGVHLVYRYRTDSTKHSCYNGQRIEIQLRTKLQHYWATAVETYSTFSGEALKSNIGSEQWMRFFALVASANAIKEDCQTVPGTAHTLDGIANELRDLYSGLKVDDVLSGWTAVARVTADKESSFTQQEDLAAADMYLLVLDPDKFEVEILGYRSDNLAEANNAYAAIEKDQPQLQAVLVSVDSLASLRTAYPNYFLDTTAFLDVVRELISNELNTGFIQTVDEQP